jgi:hypothetical protein
VDPQLIELVKALTAPLVAIGGVTGWYLLYRKFDAERAASLREDNKTLREERDALNSRIDKAEETIDQLRAKLRGDTA